MRLIIAEKPSLGRSIAKAIDGPSAPGDGFIRAGGSVVTWCFGHLLELAAPEAYNPAWAKWNIEHLPMRVRLEDWLLAPKDDAKAQIKVIQRLLKEATSVVNAGDPDREGQMLVDELLEYLGWKGKTDRLLMHDTTPESIRKALTNMRPNSEYAPLYAAARCRARADWLVGMNLTRCASRRIGLTASVGRVQTPTLALIVRRDLAIEGHTSSAFYTLHATVSTADATLTLSHETETDRILDRKVAKAIADALAGTSVELAVTETQATERAPLPFMLSTFQKAAEDRLGWSAKQSLDVLQELYEKQLVSYPRTDCAYLPEEQAKMAVPIVTRILEAGLFATAKPAHGLLAPSPRIYDNKKVAEHHGLTPTNRLPPSDLAQKLRQGWELVAEQFIKSLLPDYKLLKKEISFIHEERVFSVSGETPVNQAHSWRILEPKLKPPPLVTPLRAGDKPVARVASVQIKEGKTTPPKPYTEATLIADMKSVSKFVTDPRLKAILKETAGIGTAATQSAIIETLKKRSYIVTEGRGKKQYLKSTDFGRWLIKTIPGTLADPGVTAAWEEALNGIAEKRGQEAAFMDSIDRYVDKYVGQIKQLALEQPPPRPPQAGEKKPRGAARRPIHVT